MADLGTIPAIYSPSRFRPALIPITNYRVERGNALGTVSVYDPTAKHRPALVTPVDGYVVRQIRILYRQLWPAHGQRFPQ